MRSRPAIPGWPRDAAFTRLRELEAGTLFVTDRDGEHRFGAGSELHADVAIRDPSFYRRLIFGGSVGAIEAYAEGLWDCDDLVSLFRIFVRDMDVTDRIEGGAARVGAALYRLAHRLRRNSRSGSRRNIRAHYDLGNDLFALFLDPSMTYSCAQFEAAEATLAEAQIAKLDGVCRKLDLQPGDRLVEIGAGWGSLAIHAASHYGARVTAATISPAQAELARRRVAEAGVASRVDIVLADYRDLAGHYDKLASIEMIEAVGADQYDTYFARCRELVRPGGRLLIQAITLPDRRYRDALDRVDFIRHAMFPGSDIPSRAALCAAVGRTGRLRITHTEELGPHYARTLREWRRQFDAAGEQIAALGYPRSFARMWRAYFSYCESGFEDRYLGNAQLVLEPSYSRRG